MTIDQLSKILGLLANAATFGGIILAIILFFIERKRHRIEKELSTYSATTTDYLEYLRLCIDHPEVNVVEAPQTKEDTDSTGRNQSLILDIVVNMLERAYFLYREHKSEFRRKQWEGWNKYIKDWCQHSAFRERWPDLVEQYDEDFVNHITKIYDTANTFRQESST